MHDNKKKQNLDKYKDKNEYKNNRYVLLFFSSQK